MPHQFPTTTLRETCAPPSAPESVLTFAPARAIATFAAMLLVVHWFKLWLLRALAGVAKKTETKGDDEIVELFNLEGKGWLRLVWGYIAFYASLKVRHDGVPTLRGHAGALIM